MKQHALCSDCEDKITPMDLPIPDGLKEEWSVSESRRQFLGRCGKVLGWASLATLFGEASFRHLAFASGPKPQPGFGENTLGLPHFAPKAKRAIYLFMSGAPPQVDLFDYKPSLALQFDKDMPASVRGNQQLTGMTAGQARFPVAPSHWPFSRLGQTGTWISDLLPYTARMVDDLTFIKSTNTDAINHEPAIMLMNTGNMNAGKPCLGAWLAYGLGSMNDNLPTFVVLQTKTNPKENNQPVSSRLWSSGFLSSEFSGVGLRSVGDPVLYLGDPPGVDRDTRRKMLDAVEEINRQTLAEVGDPETNSRIAQYEMAFRMQSSVPELADLSKEPESTWELYGPEAKEPGTFAYNCLLARRLVDDTLVIWAGEFGRTVYSQGGLSQENYGRDHHPRCFTTWMTGGGVRPGVTYGETDDYSYNVVRDPVHVRDFNATILHCLGIDHNKFSYRFQGLDQKLTSPVPAFVVQGVLA